MVSILLLVGYTIFFYHIYQRFFSGSTSVKKLVSSFFSIFVVVGIFYMNTRLLPSPPDLEPLLREKIASWHGLIFINQTVSGGIKTHAANPSTPT